MLYEKKVKEFNLVVYPRERKLLGGKLCFKGPWDHRVGHEVRFPTLGSHAKLAQAAPRGFTSRVAGGF